MTDYLFVYGTLMSHSCSAHAAALARSAQLVGPAVLQGRLFLVDRYPALVVSNRSDDQVHGEIYRIVDGTVLTALDEYEECSPKFPEPTEYRRAKHVVQMPSGETFEAWVYIYNRATVGLKVLENGRFMNGPWLQDVTQE